MIQRDMEMVQARNDEANRELRAQLTEMHQRLAQAIWLPMSTYGYYADICHCAWSGFRSDNKELYRWCSFDPCRT